MRISVFGLGYVGVVTTACLAEAGHRMIGVDVQSEKVAALKEGRSPIVEPRVPEMLAQARERGLLSATVESHRAVAESDLSIVCVGTPASPSGMPDLEPIRNVGREIAAAIAAKGAPHRVILRSTVLPGTTAQWAAEFFSDLPGVEVFFYPEFLRESTAVSDFLDPSLSVIGTHDTRNPLSGLEGLFHKPPTVVDWQSAELLKYACNAWHATKVVFANEIGRIGRSIGTDSRQVMEMLCADERLNISGYYLKPGNPFGGSCLPKDILALSQFGRKTGLFLPLLEHLQESNRRHLDSLLQQVAATGKREVVILGLTFKAASDDLRESAMVGLAQALLGHGYQLRIYDPNLELERLTGKNKTLIESRMPHLASLLYPTVGEALGTSGLVVVSQKVAPIEELARHLTLEHRLIDVNGWRELASLPCPYEGSCW